MPAVWGPLKPWYLCIVCYTVYYIAVNMLDIVPCCHLLPQVKFDCRLHTLCKESECWPRCTKKVFFFFSSLDLSLASKSQSIRLPSFHIKTELIGFMVASSRLNLVQEMLITVPLSPGNLMQNCFLLLKKKWFICNAQALLYLDVSLPCAFCWYGFVSL